MYEQMTLKEETIEFGQNANFNSTLLDESRKKVMAQSMPVFIAMLCMSLSTFIAAFFQVGCRKGKDGENLEIGMGSLWDTTDIQDEKGVH